MKVGEIYKMNNYDGYSQVVEIYSENHLPVSYKELKKELGIKTSATIIKYHKSTSKEFVFGLINYMKLSDFKKNYTIVDNI